LLLFAQGDAHDAERYDVARLLREHSANPSDRMNTRTMRARSVSTRHTAKRKHACAPKLLCGSP
jgi:hypothetical protein